jgi:hypothetical protein
MDKSNRAYLREELSKRVIPYLQSLDFEPAKNPVKADARSIHPFGTFVRRRESASDIIEIQFDQHSRPSFIINFRRDSPELIKEGQFVGARNARLPKLTEFGAERFRWAESFRLTPRPKPASWFTMRTFFGFRSPKICSKEVVDRLMNLFPQVEAWFKDGKIGEHVQALPILVPLAEARNEQVVPPGHLPHK